MSRRNVVSSVHVIDYRQWRECFCTKQNLLTSNSESVLSFGLFSAVTAPHETSSVIFVLYSKSVNNAWLCLKSARDIESSTQVAVCEQ